MKQKSLILLLLILILTINTIIVHANVEQPVLKSEAALLVDNNTGKFLYVNNETKKIQPGDFVKIMTAIVAIEAVDDIDKHYVADANTLDGYNYSYGNMGILPGESLSMNDLLHGMLVYNAGDAAEVIAAELSTSRNDFIKKMNNKAVEIGALNTKFTNPTGIPSKKQYSTLEDIHLITKYAMANPHLKDIVSTSRYEIEPTNKYKKKRYLDNTNKFVTAVNTGKYFTPKANGIKTSYIDDDNCGLALLYETDEMSLSIYVAGAPYNSTKDINYAYEDTTKLIEFGSEYYTNVKVIAQDDILEEIELSNAKGIDRLLIEAKEDVFINLPTGYSEEKLKTTVKLKKDIKAPINKGEILGSLTVTYDGEEYITISLESPKEVKANHLKGLFRKLWSILTSPILLVSLGIILIIFVWAVLIFNRKKVYKIDHKH